MVSPKQTLTMVLLISLIGYIGIALPYPIFSPLFLTNNSSQLNQFMHLPPMILMGLVLAAYPAGLLVGGSYLGKLSDRLGRKPVLFWSLLGAVAGNALSALAIYLDSFMLLILSRLLTGLCVGNVAVARAIVTDLGQQINKTQSFGYLSAAGYAGYLIGPLIAGGVTGFGYGWPFAIAACLSLMTLIIVAKWLPETGLTKTRLQKNNINSGKKALSTIEFLRSPGLLACLWVYVLATLGVNTYYEFYPVYLVQNFSMDSLQIAMATFALTLSMILVAVGLLLPLEKMLGRTTVITLGFIGLGVLMILLQFDPTGWKLYGHFVLTGAVIAMYNSLYTAWMSERFKHLDQGQLMGNMVSTFCLTNIIMALAGSYIVLLSIDTLMLVGGVMAICSGLWFIYCQKLPAYNYQNNWQSKLFEY